MKCETRRWLKESHDVDGATERDILDSDARQRAEIRELRKAVRRFMLCASLDRLSDAQRLARGLIK